MPSIAMIMGIIVMLLVLVGSNCYITFRLYQGVKYIFPQLSAIIFIILGIIMVLPFILGFTRSMLPVSETVKRIFGVITSYWMGIFLYLFLYFLLFFCCFGCYKGEKPGNKGFFPATGSATG